MGIIMIVIVLTTRIIDLITRIVATDPTRSSTVEVLTRDITPPLNIIDIINRSIIIITDQVLRNITLQISVVTHLHIMEYHLSHYLLLKCHLIIHIQLVHLLARHLPHLHNNH